MKTLRTAILLATVGVLLCLWLLVKVSWYSFVAFMMVAQPLLVVAALVFVGAILRDLRRKGVL
jgi:hypothetical protein